MKLQLKTLLFVLLFTTAMLTVQNVRAYSLIKLTLTQSGGIAICWTGVKFTGDQDITANTTNLADPADLFLFIGAVSAVAERVSRVSGQSFDFNQPYGLDTTSAYTILNANSLNEIGSADLSMLGDAVAWTVVLVTPIWNSCEIVESDVYFNEDEDYAWSLPATYGVDYYDAFSNVAGEDYARPALQHEMGHMVGLNHSDHSYSFMNFGNFPWANRADEKRIELLPDDREALRAQYSNGGSEVDIGVLTTWFDSSNLAVGAANQSRLCKPSGGDIFSAGLYDSRCGETFAGAVGPTSLCPGDMLFVRYAIANYGTSTVSATPELWFSKNDWLNTTAGFDQQSPTIKSLIVLNAESSYRRGMTFEIPSTVDHDEDYYPIIFMNHTGLSTEESEQNNWIPLRDSITIKPAADC